MPWEGSQRLASTPPASGQTPDNRRVAGRGVINVPFPLAEGPLPEGDTLGKKTTVGGTMHTKHAHLTPYSRRDCRMGSTDLPWEPQPAGDPGPANDLATESRQAAQSPEELKEESRKIRRLQMVVNMVTQVIAQDPKLSVEQASEMVADTRRLALSMFPDKELAFNLIFWPRLQRLMRERYRMQ